MKSDYASLRDKLTRLVRGEINTCINAHGPVTRYYSGSAAKRIVNSEGYREKGKIMKNIDPNPLTANGLAKAASEGRREAAEGCLQDNEFGMAMLMAGAVFDAAASIVAAIDRHTEETKRLRQSVEVIESVARNIQRG